MNEADIYGLYSGMSAEGERRRREAVEKLRYAHQTARWVREESGLPARGESLETVTESGRADVTDGEPSEVCLSNRKTNCVLSTLPEPLQPISLASRWLADRKVGIDRFSISFPLAGFERDEGAWEACEVVHGVDRATGRRAPVKRRWKASVPVSETSRAFIGVNDEPEASPRYWGKVEFNPSRVVDPEGWGVASPSLSFDLIRPVIEQAISLLEPDGDEDRWLVKRLDVARDFSGVDGVSSVIAGLGPVRRPWARRNLVHADPSRHGAQTLMVGSGAGVVRLYDKWAETEGRAPEGVVRRELEARARWVQRYGGVRTVADLGPVALRALVENRWGVVCNECRGVGRSW